MLISEATEQALGGQHFNGYYVFIRRSRWCGALYLRIPCDRAGNIRIINISSKKKGSVELSADDLKATDWDVSDKDPRAKSED